MPGAPDIRLQEVPYHYPKIDLFLNTNPFIKHQALLVKESPTFNSLIGHLTLIFMFPS